jgi:hypothetical protein
MSGSILLGDVAARSATIEIACRACPRHGHLQTARLVTDHGADMAMPVLLRLLAGDCPRLEAREVHKQCDVHSPTLSALFMPIARLI